MKDGAVVCNSGHFNVEIDIPALEKHGQLASRGAPVRGGILVNDGRRIYLLGEGRLINLAAAEGHPAAVMDMSFANQALSAEYMVQATPRARSARSTPCPRTSTTDRQLKLESMGIAIDKLTPEQEQYLASWSEGT